MSGKERTYRSLNLYEWQIKDLEDRKAAGAKARGGGYTPHCDGKSPQAVERKEVDVRPLRK